MMKVRNFVKVPNKIWVGLLAVFLFSASYVLADQTCVGCVCTGNGACFGCRAAFPPNPNNEVQLGVFIQVPELKTYNYCETSNDPNDVCVSFTHICYSTGAKQGTPVYLGNDCENPVGYSDINLEVRVKACNP